MSNLSPSHGLNHPSPEIVLVQADASEKFCLTATASVSFLRSQSPNLDLIFIAQNSSRGKWLFHHNSWGISWGTMENYLLKWLGSRAMHKPNIHIIIISWVWLLFSGGWNNLTMTNLAQAFHWQNCMFVLVYTVTNVKSIAAAWLVLPMALGKIKISINYNI